ncbi:hypothetical protein [Burkholderia seminalis]|uniref:hypothetical protein n=1 Tax=Burkholderia seminalis TaxID=488731 RepID=UPI001452C4CC|nr:hypothetical protein [Burkholderia seminalis]MCA8435350.1 hypothetical protein [Burkholderia seminalis]VWC35815.1 hypothetical protein BSE24067_06677 [Burkholderia seminalis]
MITTRDQALKTLHATPAGDYEARMRAGLAAQKAGLDFLDWVQWLESHGHPVDREVLDRLWYLFQFVSARAMRILFLTTLIREAA